jgi:hypothetical protein
MRPFREGSVKDCGARRIGRTPLNSARLRDVECRVTHLQQTADIERRIARNQEWLRVLAIIRSSLVLRFLERRDGTSLAALELNREVAADLRKTVLLQQARLERTQRTAPGSGPVAERPVSFPAVVAVPRTSRPSTAAIRPELGCILSVRIVRS